MTQRRILLCIREAADLLGVSEGVAHEMVRNGILPVVVLGKRIRRVPLRALARDEPWNALAARLDGEP